MTAKIKAFDPHSTASFIHPSDEDEIIRHEIAQMQRRNDQALKEIEARNQLIDYLRSSCTHDWQDYIDDVLGTMRACTICGKVSDGGLCPIR